MVRQEPAKLRTGVRFPHAPPVNSLDELGPAPKMFFQDVQVIDINYLKRKMINTNTLKLGAVALFLSVLLGACASSSDSSSAAQESQEVQAQLLGDMPLPNAAKIIGADSLIIGRGDNWVGRAVLSGAQTPTDVYAFFQSEYPRAGWTTVSAIKAKTSILVFTKGDRTATVELNEGSLTGPKTVITITSSPKNANVVAPKK